ncbi:hypothetical protein CPB86DRAFT_728746 [Serendipita vermifera]|nr:hypothetical protein CPB86DRAFT_728746 [Serendipita vermifera]
MYSTVRGPGNCHPNSPEFESWFLRLAPGKSLWLSANRYGRSLASMQAAKSQDYRLANWNIKHATNIREEETQIYGTWERAILNKRVPEAAIKLLQGVVAKTSRSVAVVQCHVCKQYDIRIDGNTAHKCDWRDPYNYPIKARSYDKNEARKYKKPRKNGDLRPEVAPTFTCSRMLFPHQVMEDCNIQERVSEEVLLSAGFYQQPAIEFLVDEEGGALPDLPFELDPSIVGEELVWRDDDTPPHVCLAMALDRLLFEHAKLNGTMIGNPSAPTSTNTWDSKIDKQVIKIFEADPEFVEVYIHIPCGYVTLLKDHSWHCGSYDTYKVSRFTDLPYALTRAYSYKAIIEKKEEFWKVLKWVGSGQKYRKTGEHTEPVRPCARLTAISRGLEDDDTVEDGILPRHIAAASEDEAWSDEESA